MVTVSCGGHGVRDGRHVGQCDVADGGNSHARVSLEAERQDRYDDEEH